MVFLGGAFQSIESWDPVIASLIGTSTILLLDLPGSGGADVLPEHYGLDFLADA